MTPKRRAGGIGKVLFGHLGRIAKEKDCGRIEWCVLKVRTTNVSFLHERGRSVADRFIGRARDQWNAPSIGFYEKTLGAKALVEWDTMRLEGDEQISRLEKFLK